jgi:outer membrane protein assembly factor BamB
LRQGKIIGILVLVSVFYLLTIGLTGIAWATDWPQWRGPDRDGVSKETGLLKEWPEGGPKLLWSITGLGAGFSHPSIAKGCIYVTGMMDNKEYLSAFDLEGNLKWKKEYGNAYTKSFPEARTTPTVDGDYIYVISGTGEVARFDTNGNMKWKVDAFEKFGGKHGSWGIAESPLIVDNKVIYTPCGKNTTMVALDKNTGETVWTTRSLEDKSGYVSPILIEIAGKRQIVTVTGSYMVGVNPENGEIIWQLSNKDYQSPKDINAVSPVHHKGRIFVTSGYDDVGVMIELSEDGTKATVPWLNPALDTHHGGVVLVDGYIYGANWLNNRNGNWVCLEWDSGNTMYETKWFNKGSITAADGMLYCYEEKGGNLGLVKASPQEFTLVSSFKITEGKGPHWAHPVISDGKLYMRHGDVLMVYDIKAQ